MSAPNQGGEEFPFAHNVSDAEFLQHMDILAARSSPAPGQSPSELDSTDNVRKYRGDSTMTVFPGHHELSELGDSSMPLESVPTPRSSPPKSPAQVNKPFPPLPPLPGRTVENVGIGSPLKFAHRNSLSQGSIECFGPKAMPPLSKQSTEVVRPASALKHSAEIPRPGSSLKFEHQDSPKVQFVTPPTFSSKGKRRQPPPPLKFLTPESPSTAGKAKELLSKPSLENVSLSATKRSLLHGSRSFESLRTPFKSKKSTAPLVANVPEDDQMSPCPPQKKPDENRMGTFKRLVLNRFRSEEAVPRDEMTSEELPKIIVDPKGNRTRRYEEENPRVGIKKQENKGLKSQGLHTEPINEEGRTSRQTLVKESSATKKVEVQHVPRIESQRVVSEMTDDRGSIANPVGFDAFVPRGFRPSTWLEPVEGVWENNASVGHTLLPFSSGLPVHPAFRDSGSVYSRADGPSQARPQVVSELMGSDVHQAALRHNSWGQQLREPDSNPLTPTSPTEDAILDGIQQSIRNIEQGMHYYLEGSLSHVVRHTTDESNRTIGALVEKIHALETRVAEGMLELETVKGELLQQRKQSSERLAGVLNAVNLTQSFSRTADSKVDAQKDAIALLGEKQQEIQNVQSQLLENMKALVEATKTASATAVFIAQQQQELGEKNERVLQSLLERMTANEKFTEEVKWCTNTVNCRMTEDMTRLRVISKKLDDLDAKISCVGRTRKWSDSAGTVEGKEKRRMVEEWRNVTGSTNIVEKAMLFDPGVEHRPPPGGGENRMSFAEALSKHNQRPNHRPDSASMEGTVRRRKTIDRTPTQASFICAGEGDEQVFESPPAALILRPRPSDANNLQSGKKGGMEFEIERSRDTSRSIYSQQSSSVAATTGSQKVPPPRASSPKTPPPRAYDPKTPPQKSSPPRTPPPRGPNPTMRVMSGPFGMQFEVPEDLDAGLGNGEYAFY